MKIGDLVRLTKVCGTQKPENRVGIVVDIVQKKVWRTDGLGNAIDWNKVGPEDHATVMYDDCQLNIPIVDLETVTKKTGRGK